jgi:Zn-dependent protease
MDDIIRIITVYALPIIFAITLHEAAHGYVARYFGDNTAYALGRVSVNPLKHIDPLGTIAIPVALAIATSGAFTFGYAKPVPVTFDNLRNPKRDMIWVALAGPATNFVQAVVWALIAATLMSFGVKEKFLLEVFSAGILVNALMFAFNLFPLPPLDGGRIVTGLLPKNLAIPYARLERYGFFIVLALVAFAPLRPVLNMWVIPLTNFVYAFITLVLKLFA